VILVVVLWVGVAGAQQAGVQQAGGPAAAPEAARRSPFAGLIAEYLQRDADGHSPEPDDIVAMGTLKPSPDADSIAEAVPLLTQALASSDVPMRTFALTTLLGLQAAPETAAGTGAVQPAGQTQAAGPANAAGPAAYKPEVARVLAAMVPVIAGHLTSEEGQTNRMLAAQVLGGFSPHPPAAVYPPLLEFLKRDDAVGAVGLQVVTDLFQLGPLSNDAVQALTRYVRRSDQTYDGRANLTDLLATRPNQSQVLNQQLLFYLESDDNSLRARVILSLPQLDLAPGVFQDTKAKVEQIAANPNENLQVVTAAKAVAPCWTEAKMTTGCPAY
jgi:hypothetical protein